MKMTDKGCVKMGVSLVVVGLLVFAGAMLFLGFDFSRLGTTSYETNTYEISGDFSSITIGDDTTSIDFALSKDESCQMVCYEDKRVKHSATVKDGTLTIRTVDTRKWYDHIGLSFTTPHMTVYLPKPQYAALLVTCTTGNITIPKDFAFETVDLSVSTGQVACYAPASEEMNIKTTTGSIRVENVSVGALDLSVTTGGIKVSSIHCEGDVNVGVTTGRAELTDVSCKGLISNGTTGGIILHNVIASESISIKRSTGDVTFDGSDAAEISVKTSTGNVKGTLLSEKVFLTESKTGSIHVPKTVTGGPCEIKTSTGSIHIEIP